MKQNHLASIFLLILVMQAGYQLQETYNLPNHFKVELRPDEVLKDVLIVKGYIFMVSNKEQLFFFKNVSNMKISDRNTST